MSRYAQASLSSGDDADGAPPSPSGKRANSGSRADSRVHRAVAVDSSRVFSVRAMDEKGETVDLAYTNCSVTGHGSFGVVMRAELVQGGEGVVALKRTRQDRRFKVRFVEFGRDQCGEADGLRAQNRELQIMRLLHHPSAFASVGADEGAHFLVADIFLLRYYYYEAASERARRRRCVPRCACWSPRATVAGSDIDFSLRPQRVLDYYVRTHLIFLARLSPF